MQRQPSPLTNKRLETERNIWMASVRADGRPHLVPVWFVWHAVRFYIGMKEHSVKANNIRNTPLVSLSLEDGSQVVICEGSVKTVNEPYPAGVLDKFKLKYDWDIPADEDYGLVIEVTPTKWLIWGEEGNYA